MIRTASAATARRSESDRADTGLLVLHAVLQQFDPAVLPDADQAGITRILDEPESHALAASSPHPMAPANAMVRIGLARHRFGLHEDAGHLARPAGFERGPFDRARGHAIAVRAGRTALARRLREPSDAPMVSSDPVVALRMIRDAEGDDAAAAAADRLRAEWTRIDAAIRALLR